MKIKILAVLAVVTVIVVSMFMREKREDPSYDIYLTKQTLESQGGVKNYRTICWDRAVRVFSGDGRKFKYKCMKKKFFYLKQITL